MWDELIRERYVKEYLDGVGSIEDLSDEVDRLADLVKRFRESSSRAGIQATPRDWHFLASAGVNASLASKDDEVIAFRNKHLPDGLLKQDQVEEWISRIVEEEGRGDRIAEVPIPRTLLRGTSDLRIRDLIRILRHLPPEQPVGGCDNYLAFGVPEDRYQRLVPVSGAGKTGALKRVAAKLGRDFGWQEGLAVVFVLTGAVPIPWIATLSVEGPIGGSSRVIRIDVDARCAPQRLAAEFARVREKALGVEKGGRYKPITSERSMHLALFHVESPEGTWRERMECWNKEHSQLAYSDKRTFKHHVESAYRRVAGLAAIQKSSASGST